MTNKQNLIILTTSINNWDMVLFKKPESNVIGSGGYCVKMEVPKLYAIMNYDTMEKAMAYYTSQLELAMNDPQYYVREWEQDGRYSK